MSHKTDPDADLHDPNNLGDAVPGHRAGCAVIGVTGEPGQRIYYLEDVQYCDCGAIDWTVYQVCGYDHNIVKRSEYTRHHLTNHNGLAAERDSHATVCELAGRCICRLEEYEQLAAVMAAEREQAPT